MIISEINRFDKNFITKLDGNRRTSERSAKFRFNLKAISFNGKRLSGATRFEIVDFIEFSGFDHFFCIILRFARVSRALNLLKFYP